MKLQRIYYGPPGTGKTFLLKEEAVKILSDINKIDTQESKDNETDGSKSITGILMKLNKFYNDNMYLLTESDYKPGKKCYRNLYPINRIIKNFIKENKNILESEFIKRENGWNGPSTYVQHERIITNFGLSETSWQDGSRLNLELNDKGIEIKNKYEESYENIEDIPEDSLPDFVIEAFIDELINTDEKNMSLWKNTIITTLRLGLEQGYIFQYKSKSKPNDAEKQALKKCFNYESEDMTFLPWVIAYLRNLNLVSEGESDSRIKKYYLNSRAMVLLSKIKCVNNQVLATEEIANEEVIQEKMYIMKEANKIYRKTIDSRYNNFKENEERIEFITMHESFEYENFIEGITANCKDENLSYYYKTGVLKLFCLKALKNVILNNNDNISLTYNELEEKLGDWVSTIKCYKEFRKVIDWNLADDYIFIIDELNRGDIVKVFGEMLTLIENEKRLGGRDEITVKLPYTQDEFGIPKNIQFLCTMNTADRSIGNMDLALRRRFQFVPTMPKLNLIKDLYNPIPIDMDETENFLYKSAKAIEYINSRIKDIPFVGQDKTIGHAYLILGETIKDEDILSAWKYDIFPYLEELFFEQISQLIEAIGEHKIIDEINGFYKEDNQLVIDFIDTLLTNKSI